MNRMIHQSLSLISVEGWCEAASRRAAAGLQGSSSLERSQRASPHWRIATLQEVKWM
jgi:hypothetical protein